MQNRDDIKHHIVHIDSLLQSNQLEKAAQYSQQVLARMADDIHAIALRLKLSDALSRQSKYELADRQYFRVLQLQPANKWAWLGKVKNLIQQNKLPEAISQATQGLQILPHDAHLVTHLASALQLNQQASEAIKTLQDTLLEYHTLADQNTLQLALAKHYADNKNYTDATAAYLQLIVQDPTNLWANVGLINGLLQQKQTTAALKAIEQAEQHCQQHQFIYLKKAELLSLNHQHQDVTALLSGLVATGEANDGIYLKLASSYNQTQQFNLAQTTLEQLLTRSPNNKWAQLAVIDNLLTLEKTNQAIQLLASYVPVFLQNSEPAMLGRLIELIKKCQDENISLQLLKNIETTIPQLPETALRQTVGLAKSLKYTALTQHILAELETRQNLTIPTIKLLLHDAIKGGKQPQDIDINHYTALAKPEEKPIVTATITADVAGSLVAYRYLQQIAQAKQLDYIQQLAPIYIGAGKARALQKLIAPLLSQQPANIDLNQIHIKALIATGQLHQAKQHTNALLAQYPVLKQLFLTLLAHIEYNLDNANAAMALLLTGYQHTNKLNDYCETLMIYCVTETLPAQREQTWQQCFQLIMHNMPERKKRSVAKQIMAECYTPQQPNAEHANDTRFSTAIHTVLAYYLEQKRQKDVKPEANLGAVIPLNIMQYWDKPNPPAPILALCETWQQQAGFSYQRFTFSEALYFIKTQLTPQHVRAFRLCNQAAEQADYFRLCYLYCTGGVYADCDDMCVGNLGDYLATQHAPLVLFKDAFGVGNNFIASSPKHPVIAATLTVATHNLLMKKQDSIWMKTGPGCLIENLSAYIQATKHKLHVDKVSIGSVKDEKALLLKRQSSLHQGWW